MTESFEAEKVLAVKWKVQVPSYGCGIIKSPSFRIRDSKWFIDCFETSKREIFLIVSRYVFGFETCTTYFSVVVEVHSDSTGVVLPTLTETRVDVVPGRCIWKRSFEDILRVESTFSRTRRLTFRMMLKEELSTIQTDQKSGQTPLYLECLEGLSDDFAKLLDADSDPDVELHCEDHITKAHKTVLCSRSPVLASMLQSDMVEGRTGVVKFPNMEVDIFQKFIRYLYTGKLDELTIDSATRLYEAGDMYKVQCLTRRSSDFLIKNLTVKNACDILTLADVHCDSSFREAVIDFIMVEKIPQTDYYWPAYCDQNPSAADKVLNRMVKN